MHILFLSDNFPPEVNAPASRTFEHAREWVRAGEKVTVITTAPNFPRGKVFAGYSNGLWSKETVEGVTVVRVWTYITANEGFVRRSLDFISFMITATLASIFVRRVDVVVATSPQFFTACAGRITALLKGAPFVFELRDIWPESIKAVGALKDGALLHALEKIELSLYRGARLIVVVTHAFRRILVARGVAEDKIRVITNGADLSRFRPLPKPDALVDALSLRGTFIVGYIGTHGMAHDLTTIIAAAGELATDPDLPPLHLILLGDGAEKSNLIAYASKHLITNVSFIDSVSKDEVVRYWSLLDASVIHLVKTDLFKTVIPSKMFESMAMGIPVAMGVEGEAAEIVREHSCGVLFEPSNIGSCAAALRQLMTSAGSSDLSENGVAAARNYDRSELAMRMLRYLRSIAGPTVR